MLTMAYCHCMWQCLLYISAMSFFVQVWHERVLPKFWHGNVYVCTYVCLYVCVYLHTQITSWFVSFNYKVAQRYFIKIYLITAAASQNSIQCVRKVMTCKFCATLSGQYHSNLKVISWASLNTVRWHEHILAYLLNSYTELICSGNFVPFSLHF
jgi:hypothetical protein